MRGDVKRRGPIPRQIFPVQVGVGDVRSPLVARVESIVAGVRLPDWPAVDLPEEHWSTRFLTGLGMVLDSGLLRAMRLVVDAALVPDPAVVADLREAAVPY